MSGYTEKYSGLQRCQIREVLQWTIIDNISVIYKLLIATNY